MALVTDRFAVKRAILEAHNSPWKQLHRIENTGGGVNEVIDAVNSVSFERLLYAEGDSWFDKFTPIPRSGTNLLDTVRTPFFTGVVDVSHIGDEARDMVRGHQARQTETLFAMFPFDAILLSAGGNDLKNLFSDLFARKARINAGLPTVLSDDELNRLATPSSFTEFFDDVMLNIKRFVDLRNGADDPRTRRARIFVHGYDYLQPRPAAAVLFSGSRIGAGPWLYPSMHDAGLTDEEMRATADAVVDELNNCLRDRIAILDNVIVIDHRGLLIPAPAGSTDESEDWMDEIHPNKLGFTKLARNRWDVPLSTTLGWPAQVDDLAPALDPPTTSTARAEPLQDFA